MTLIDWKTLTPVGCSIIAVLVLWIQTWASESNPKGLPYPPGPKPLPILGNAFNLPKLTQWLTFTQWAKSFGDLCHISVLGRHFVFVNSTEVAVDLFTKRSTKYSDRPRLVMINEVAGWDWCFALMSYGLRWRNARKLFHQHVDQAAPNYHAYQVKEAYKLTKKLHETPTDFANHIRHASGAIIMQVMYGIDVKDRNDIYITAAENATAILNRAGQPIYLILDIFPKLKNVPAWVPGAGIKNQAKIWRKQLQEFIERPYEATKKSLEGLEHTKFSATANMIREAGNMTEEEEQELKNVAAIGYAAGSDSSIVSILYFILAMRLHPDIQTKAQAQIDDVVGRSRLPVFADRPNLPYIEAIMMEILRWHPVGPIVPHCLSKDDEYRGYFLPKGTMVFGNAWAILHDEKIYPNPLEFNPERFLDKNSEINPEVPHPDIACFGFGRRICPGRTLGSSNLFIIIASILATLKVIPIYDENGEPIPVKDDVADDIVAYPKSFKASFEPRSKIALSLIEESLANRSFE